MNRNIFNMGLKSGMETNEILNELNGCVSGETTQEFGRFVEKPIYALDNDELPLHSVLMNDDRYALIGKSVYRKFANGKKAWENRYYLCGVNDEQKYFIKEIENFDTVFPIYPSSIDEIVNKINKTEDNYSRVQGDVLAKTISFEELVWINEFSFNYNNTHFEIVDDIRNKQKGIFNKEIKTVIHASYNGEEHPLRIFGNHELSTDGVIFSNQPRNKYHTTFSGVQESVIDQITKLMIVRGNWFRFDHDQHRRIETKINPKDCILLEPQIVRPFGLGRRRDYD